MTNVNPLTIDEAKNRILPLYHLVLQIIAEEYIMPSEKILFAANTTRHEVFSYKPVFSLTRERKEKVSNVPTLLIVTNQRWIKWSFMKPWDEIYSIPMKKKEYGDNLIFEWCVPPAKFPHDYLTEQKLTVREYVTSLVVVNHLSKISIETRSEFVFTDPHTNPETQLHILRVLLNTGAYYSLKYDDGVYLHKLLQLASLNQGKILIQEEPSDDFQKLEKLKLMFENGLITEIEYQEKKAQLLTNM